MEDVVDVEFAEGEADPYMVALAGKLGAYVMANDSDFAVLHCEGYKVRTLPFSWRHVHPAYDRLEGLRAP